MNNPFSEYLPYEEQGKLYLKKIFAPKVTIISNPDGSIEARTGSCYNDLLLRSDIRKMANTNINDAQIESFMQENLLTLTLESFLEEVAKGNEHGILKVSETNSIKEYVVDSNEKYILKHKGRSNFVILEKEAAPSGLQRYQMEKSAYHATEIDSLGYLLDEKPYLIIGEASISSKFTINAWRQKHEKDVYERLFIPLQVLFSDHQLVYLLLKNQEVLFSKELEIAQRGYEIYEELKKINVQTLFVPAPQTDPSLKEIVEKTLKHIDTIKAYMNQRKT